MSVYFDGVWQPVSGLILNSIKVTYFIRVVRLYQYTIITYTKNPKGYSTTRNLYCNEDEEK